MLGNEIISKLNPYASEERFKIRRDSIVPLLSSVSNVINPNLHEFKVNNGRDITKIVPFFEIAEEG